MPDITPHGYCITPNLVNKFVIPSLTASESRTFVFILAQTCGWSRESAAISTSFFIAGTKDQMGTGLSRQGQRKAVKALLKRGWIAITGYEDRRMAGHSVNVPVYEICWAAIGRAYAAWMESAAVARAAATVVASPPATGTGVGPVRQMELPPSRNRSCPSILHTPIEQKEYNTPSTVASAAPQPAGEMSAWEWLTGERLEPIEVAAEGRCSEAWAWLFSQTDSENGLIEDRTPTGPKEEVTAPSRALTLKSAQETWLDSATDEELERAAETRIVVDDDSLSAQELETIGLTEDQILSLGFLPIQGNEEDPAGMSQDDEVNSGSTPSPISAPPPSPASAFVVRDGQAFRILDAVYIPMPNLGANAPAIASEDADEWSGCGNDDADHPMPSVSVALNGAHNALPPSSALPPFPTRVAPMEMAGGPEPIGHPCSSEARHKDRQPTIQAGDICSREDLLAEGGWQDVGYAWLKGELEWNRNTGKVDYSSDCPF